MNKNIKHFLVTFLVSVVCLFVTSSCLTTLIVEASRNLKQRSIDIEDNREPKPIPGNYDFSRVTPSGQRLYYNKLFVVEEDLRRKGLGSYFLDKEYVNNHKHESFRLVGVEVTHPDDSVRSGRSKIGSNYLTDDVVVVPEKIAVGQDSLPVIQIGQNAFRGCDSVSAIVLPKTIRRIFTSNAFEGMLGLQTIVLFSRGYRGYVNDFSGLYSEEKNEIGKRKLVPVVHWVPEVKNYSSSDVRESFFAIPKGFDVYKGGNIEEFLESKKEFIEMHLDIWRTWGINASHEIYDFALRNQQGQLLCYKILDPNEKTVAFVNPMYESGNYVTGNVIIPPTISFEGTTYTVTTIEDGGLKCDGASSYFIPSTVSTMNGLSYRGIVRGSVKFYVCNATTPPQLPEPFEGDLIGLSVKYATLNGVVQVPKGCLDKYKTAETWNQQPELIMEVDDDFQQYLDEGRIDEYMEKAKNSINFEQMWDAQRNFSKKMEEQRQKEEQAILEKREKERQAELKKEMDQSKKQYGAKYVDALWGLLKIDKTLILKQ